MDKVIFNLAVTLILTAGTIFFSGCNSSDKTESTDTTTEEVANDVDQTADEWTTYKTDIEVRIDKNNAKIAELREKMKTSGKTMDKMHQERIDNLEKRNNELKAKLDAYTKDDSNWESFKNEFNHDMEELEKSLEDIGKDNVK